MINKTALLKKVYDLYCKGYFTKVMKWITSFWKKKTK